MSSQKLSVSAVILEIESLAATSRWTFVTFDSCLFVLATPSLICKQLATKMDRITRSRASTKLQLCGLCLEMHQTTFVLSKHCSSTRSIRETLDKYLELNFAGVGYCALANQNLLISKHFSTCRLSTLLLIVYARIAGKQSKPSMSFASALETLTYRQSALIWSANMLLSMTAFHVQILSQ